MASRKPPPAKEKPRLSAGPSLLSLEIRSPLVTRPLVRVRPLARVLLLLAGLLAAALLLAGLLTRILILLTRVLTLLARILVLFGHRNLRC